MISFDFYETKNFINSNRFDITFLDFCRFLGQHNTFWLKPAEGGGNWKENPNETKNQPNTYKLD